MNFGTNYKNSKAYNLTSIKVSIFKSFNLRILKTNNKNLNFNFLILKQKKATNFDWICGLFVVNSDKYVANNQLLLMKRIHKIRSIILVTASLYLNYKKYRFLILKIYLFSRKIFIQVCTEKNT